MPCVASIAVQGPFVGQVVLCRKLRQRCLTTGHVARDCVWHRGNESARMNTGMSSLRLTGMFPMFRRVRNLVRAHRERLLALVMLPAFVWATLPHAACICLAGHCKTICNTAGCACCQPASSTSSCCCRAESPENAPVQSSGPALAAAPAGHCCHPILQSPPPAKPVEKLTLPSQWDHVFSFELLGSAGVEQHHTAQRGPDDHGPPPLDAVIVFVHLTI
jgi:hypothetical protein